MTQQVFSISDSYDVVKCSCCSLPAHWLCGSKISVPSLGSWEHQFRHIQFLHFDKAHLSLGRVVRRGGANTGCRGVHITLLML